MDWQVLEAIDPYGERREDYRNAHLIAQLANMLSARKGEPHRAEEFLLEFKEKGAQEEQSQAQVEAMIKTWVAAANITHRKPTKH
jgi:hypothetical protein